MEVPWEERHLSHVGGAGQPRYPPLEPDGETAVRRHAVPERLEVAVKRGEVGSFECGYVVVVAVKPLAS